MASKLTRAVPPTIKPLAEALCDGHRYPPAEMFRFFLGAVMELWGFQPWYPIPDDVRGKIGRAITLYDQAVAHEEPFKDILGPLYEELASHGGKQMLGQFFTPWSLASMMVRMSDSDIDAPRAGVLKAYSDPACGSGVMLLAKANYLLETKGPGELQQWLFHACDIDGICARMVAIQLAANCAIHKVEIGEIIVLQGDTLSVSDTKQQILRATSPTLMRSRQNSIPKLEVAS